MSKSPSLPVLVALFVALGCGGVNTVDNSVDASVVDGGDDEDAATVDASPDGEPLGPPHRVFATSISTFTANLGGFVGADASCEERASRGGLTSTGTWKAVLRGEATSLEQRLRIDGPVMNINGDLLASTPTDFFAGNFLKNNLVSETGSLLPTPSTSWIGTDTGSCMDWTFTSSQLQGATAEISDLNWTTSNATVACGATQRLQCIEQF